MNSSNVQNDKELHICKRWVESFENEISDDSDEQLRLDIKKVKHKLDKSVIQLNPSVDPLIEADLMDMK